MKRDTDIEISLASELAADKAAPLFRLFGWTYRGGDIPPTVFELQNDIEKMIYDLRKIKGECSQQSGRFEVMKERTEEGTFDYTISLPLANLFGIHDRRV